MFFCVCIEKGLNTKVHNHKKIDMEENIHEIIAKKLSGEISNKELIFLNKWLSLSNENKDLYSKLKSIWKHAAEFSVDFNPDISKAIIKYKERVEKAKQLKKSKFRIIRLSQLVAAAVIVLSLGFFINSYINTKDLITVTSDSTATKQILLPDSSIIYLNKNTEITYNKIFKERIVELKGEAFFEVKKLSGNSFIVETEKTNIKVLGTSFNVKAISNKNKTNLSVLTGKVQFTSNESNKKAIVTPNQQATYDNLSSEILKIELKNSNFLSWKTGNLSFNNESFKDVIKTLSDNYNMKFNVIDKKIYDLQLTCEFNNQTIEEILEDMEIILPIIINKDKKNYQISSLPQRHKDKKE